MLLCCQTCLVFSVFQFSQKCLTGLRSDGSGLSPGHSELLCLFWSSTSSHETLTYVLDSLSYCRLVCFDTQLQGKIFSPPCFSPGLIHCLLTCTHLLLQLISNLDSSVFPSLTVKHCYSVSLSIPILWPCLL